MGKEGVARHDSQFIALPKLVFFTGTTALKAGQGLYYDRDTGTATSEDTGRVYNVELGSTTNHRWFAGVTDRSYAANSSGQFIQVYEPGSVCPVLTGSNTVVPTGIASGTVLHCCVSTGAKGLFVNPGYTGLVGRGCAIALRTTTSVIASSFAGAATTSSTTLTHTAQFGSVAVGDVVYIFGGTGAAVTPQELTVTSISGAPNAVTLSAAPGNGNVTYVIVRNDPTVIARLLDYDEDSGVLVSGSCEFVSPSSNAAAQSMVGGTTFLCGGYTIAADSTATLADGVLQGEKKAFCGLGTLTTQDWLLTVTSGIQKDHATALATGEIDAAGEGGVLTWWWGKWMTEYSNWTEA